MANEGRETSEGCDWSDDLLLGKSWKSSKIGIWKFCAIRKCHYLILFVGLGQIKSIIKLVNEYILIDKKHQNPLYLNENNIIEIAFLHRGFRSISYLPFRGYEMQLALRLVYDINEDLQKLLVQNLEIKWNSILSELVDVDIFIYIYIPVDLLNFRSSLWDII